MKASASTRARFEAVIAAQFGLEMTAACAGEVDRILLGGARGPFSDADAYLDWLEGRSDDDPEWTALAARLTVGETYFFRDQMAFDALEKHVVPAILAARRAQGALRLRLWSAGCATGEEAYSLAIVLDRALPDRRDWAVTMLATDINAEALAHAARGVYRPWALRAIAPDVRRRYFEARGGEAFELDPEIRRMVSFAPLNLRRDAFPNLLTNTVAMDVILCRNVFIYLTPETQRETAARLGRALAPGGWLVTSPVEASVDVWAPLSPVNVSDAILFHARPPAPPSLARGTDAWTASAMAVQESGVPPALVAAPEAPSQAEGPPADPLDEARRRADAGRLAEARALCEAVVARAPFDVEARVLLGAICQEQEDVRGAREALRVALYLAPDLAAAHLLLGTVQSHAGDVAGARQSMAVVLRLLHDAAPGDIVPAGGGVTAGRLLATARTYLSVLGQDRRGAHGV